MISFGKKIAILRKEKGLSQGELAAQLKTSVSVISRYERDEMIPSIEAAKKLADLLDFYCWLSAWRKQRVEHF